LPYFIVLADLKKKRRFAFGNMNKSSVFKKNPRSGFVVVGDDPGSKLDSARELINRDNR
jgi:hypothetical protein